ncbi:MAG: major facilitator superfamily domain-containing protein 9, partial [Chloroflexi bacterium]|nr:major facilitator superfamily domain-containing protein 9 [Chloroflexota bacterium]
MEFIAFGMIIPLSPYLARDFGADDLEVGLLMSVYSLAQLIFAPLWGYLSDHLGRKPIILTCLLGSALFYLWFSFANTLEVLFLTRVLAGVFGAVMSVSMACIADVTGEKERSRNMGLVGAAIGLGFIIGPFLGGIFGLLGQQLGNSPPFGSSFSALGAGFVCLVNL